MTDLLRGAAAVLKDLGFVSLKEPGTWRRTVGEYLLEVQSTERGGAGTWWLTIAGTDEDPGLEFSGSFGAVVLQLASVINVIGAGCYR